MEPRSLLKNPPEKVLLMYQAVVDMVSDGMDINSMKVSDITVRAGIGKGTAYEYFSSKEELITKALVYDVERKLEILEKIVESDVGFARKLEQILSFVEEKFSENQTFCMLVRIGTGSYEISETLKKEYERVQEKLSYHRVEQIIDRIMEQGAAEGLFAQENRDLRRIAFSAQIIAFAAYLVSMAGRADQPLKTEEARRFVCEALLKSLN